MTGAQCILREISGSLSTMTQVIVHKWVVYPKSMFAAVTKSSFLNVGPPLFMQIVTDKSKAHIYWHFQNRPPVLYEKCVQSGPWILESFPPPPPRLSTLRLFSGKRKATLCSHWVLVHKPMSFSYTVHHVDNIPTVSPSQSTSGLLNDPAASNSFTSCLVAGKHGTPATCVCPWAPKTFNVHRMLDASKIEGIDGLKLSRMYASYMIM